MTYLEPAHWQFGIYHVRKISGGWRITVEDGKGLPFDPVTVGTLTKARAWLGA